MSNSRICSFWQLMSRARGASPVISSSSARRGSPYSTQPPLTLDDVLPQAETSSSSSPEPRHQLQSTTPRNNGLNSRASILPQLNRRSSFELASDPIRRRSGERTHYSLIVRSTSNNTRLTLTHTPISYLPGSSPGNPDFKLAYPMAGSVVARVTAGSVGFKRGRRQEYEAATQACLSMFNKIRELLTQSPVARASSPARQEGIPRELEIVFDGFGVGRDAFIASLLNSQASDLREMVRSVRDNTTVKIGGPRPKKRRRV
ncbi:hypothetical protein O181_016864 [Austropuccinia psidii MF-1]|uniref:Translational machinery component n=1 Tax=Austropuccinia psidii MF-1 TaxID=1389203 RepID=A0A9Q3C2I6_9BASI|nr:hypothetical protein [Austropuccinia psidii MF-1]